MRLVSVSLPVLLLAGVCVARAEDERQPRPLADNPRLAYPEAARRYGITGEVSFEADVDEKGAVTRVEVRSVPKEDVGFEAGVREGVSKWRFAPAVVDGRPVRGTYAASIMFRLHPDDEASIREAVGWLAAAWNRHQADDVVRQFDFSTVPSSALGRSGLKSESELRTWLAPLLVEGAPALMAGTRSIRFATVSLAWTEMPFESAGSMFGMLVKRNDSWRLVRLDPESAPGQKAIRVGGEIKEPRKLKNVAPAYPDDAKAARIQGVVILECEIDAQGHISDIQVLTGPPALVGPAKAAVRQWVYTPTLLDGVAVPVIMTVTVNFRLQ